MSDAGEGGDGSGTHRRRDLARMRRYWDKKARENAMYYIQSELDYAHVDRNEFWASGDDSLARTLSPFDLSVQPTDEVVDIGCGIGRTTRALATKARHVIGVDVSLEMVERGRKELADLGNVELLLGNGRDLSGIGDASVDVVYSFIVFQHIPDPAITCEYIQEIGRVLRPGGWTVFQVSELPEIHHREMWRGSESVRTRAMRLLGRAPRGTLAPEWLGSALSHDQLVGALDDAGLVLAASVGEGSQFCLVHARRPL
ncbi:MAG TPA: hypothetical protein DCQ30_00915 [Acidimicrobiaceae bacterium]|nr:hypothetical protein [Acidimicrobiaceae bacterium]